MPVTRSKLIAAKALTALVNCVVLSIITGGATLGSVATYQPKSDFYSFLNFGMLALFFMQIIFLAIGIFLGCAMKQHKRAGSVAVSVLLVTYLFSVISGLNENLKFLQYFPPLNTSMPQSYCAIHNWN